MTISENVLLAPMTHFHIGGPARFFVEGRSIEDIQEALSFARDHEFRLFILGGGSNVLVSDAGFDGLVIRLAMRRVTIVDTVVTAEAGALATAVARKTAQAGLRGLEWMISLPGTIGGAVRGNAGCFGGETCDTLASVLLLRNRNLIEIPVSELKMQYRDSILKSSDDIVVSAKFHLAHDDSNALLRQLEQMIERRKSSQPLSAKSAGCLFKNVEFETQDDISQLAAKVEIPKSMREAKRISAGWIIDQLGLKGMRIGQAKISEEHGNFILNLGGATADEVLQLVSLVKTRARNNFGVQLHEEVQFIQ